MNRILWAGLTACAFCLSACNLDTLMGKSHSGGPSISDLISSSSSTVSTAVPDPNSLPTASAAHELSGYGYDTNAFYVAPGDRLNLQTALDRQHSIRLGLGDYRTNGLSRLVIHSGDKIYGINGTQIPTVEVSAGVQNAVISNVSPWTMSFDSGASIQNNLFLQVHADAIGNNVSLENNLFVGWTGALQFDNSSSGYLRNNRFIRTIAHNGASPYLRLVGNSATPTTNNTFVFYNFLTPRADTSDLRNLDDLTFVGVDAESWNYNNQGTDAVIKANAQVGILRMMATNGGDNVHSSNDSNATGYFDVGARNFLLINDVASAKRNPKTYLRSSVDTAVLLTTPALNSGGNGFAQESSTTTLYQASDSSSAPVPSSSQTLKLRNLLITAPKARAGAPWAAPVFTTPPDPAGPNWQVGLATMPDSTTFLQGLIETQTVAMIPAGTYYISSPLKLKEGHGMIGAGMNSTVIIAKDPSIDLVIGDQHYANPYSITSFVMSDLTLQGGTNGLHHGRYGSGPGAQYNEIMLSHVNFRNMSNAGIFIDYIFSWDNNLIDHVNFVNCGNGILQKVNPDYSGGDAPGMTYLDKNLFYHNQFIANGTALNLQGNRANNLDIWVDNLFRDNSYGAMDATSTVSGALVNSDFSNNGGSAVLKNDGNTMSLVNCRFQAGASGAPLMLQGAFGLEGSSFSQAGGSASILGNGTGSNNSFYNSNSTDMSVGTVQNGLLFNNFFQRNSNLSLEGIAVSGANSHILLNSSVTAPVQSQFLFGQNFGISY